MTTPVLLLDVDGVLNAGKAGWSRAPHGVNVWSPQDRQHYRIRYEPRCLAAIRRLHDNGIAEVRWSTTWCPDIRLLEDALLNIGPYETAFAERLPHRTWSEMKLNAALHQLDDGRRIVWVDDVEVDAARTSVPQIADAEKTGQALLVAPHPGRGLRPDDLDHIETFCRDTPESRHR